MLTSNLPTYAYAYASITPHSLIKDTHVHTRIHQMQSRSDLICKTTQNTVRDIANPYYCYTIIVRCRRRRRRRRPPPIRAR
ncbi:hypothetical protein BU24DRAFT_424643 [Aaosphaeria arxii CBS 175.79]|uniref:Uncharacterized protein n=1 Tax=Aaosphaeria arxii CBS 175.79 TaxID=1450172 RepID=A0A6A5XMT0_9PLEO|nr:uncharacterized protein BU24DRAFT_424643 [Aaosphaeria arxii CBS 175.79]KAF2013644.1 hypothetical protein BU24DRAFT_424643 [Aaosphaeria arxii CBS 175.79]